MFYPPFDPLKPFLFYLSDLISYLILQLNSLHLLPAPRPPLNPFSSLSLLFSLFFISLINHPSHFHYLQIISSYLPLPSNPSSPLQCPTPSHIPLIPSPVYTPTLFWAFFTSFSLPPSPFCDHSRSSSLF